MTELTPLPAGWKWVKLGEVGKIVSGGTPSTIVNSYWNGNIPWITPADLSGYQNKFIERGRKSISIEGLKNSSARLMPKGSVLFSSRAPIGYVVIASNELCTNQGFKSVIPNNNISSVYLYYFLKFSKNAAEKVASGTTFKEISLKNFSDLNFPLPPLHVQQAIVSKIEELFSELDKGIEDLKTAQLQLKTYRQSVLKWAFEGKLSLNFDLPDVPDGHDVPLAAEPVAPYSPDSSDSELYPLPKGWKWVRLGEVSPRVTVGYVGPMKTEYVSSGIPFLRGQNVRTNRYDSTGLKYIKPEFHKKLAKSSLAPGDILVVRSGNVGTTCVVPTSLQNANCSDLVIIKKPKNVNSQFISYYLNSVVETKIYAQKVGVALVHFNTKTVENFSIPLPSTEEQNQIVQEIESRLSVADKMEETINQSLQQAEVLRQSILKRAFEGKLV